MEPPISFYEISDRFEVSEVSNRFEIFLISHEVSTLVLH